MIVRKQAQPSDSFSVHADKQQSLKKGCRAYNLLNQWQLRKYKRAVAENKWYMGERLGRHVGWTEAEADFLRQDFYGCAPIWRTEYCGSRCSFQESCELGKQFCSEHQSSLQN